jgi:predicted secreted protein
MVFLVLPIWFSCLEVSGAEMITLKRPDGGKDYTVQVGAVIQVELEEQGATGYLWQLDALDQRLLDLERMDSVVNDGHVKPGAPLRKTWRLKAKHKGKTRLEFSYCRPWEGKDASLDRFVVQISIE